jgi:hypothetical protein
VAISELDSQGKHKRAKHEPSLILCSKVLEEADRCVMDTVG